MKLNIQERLTILSTIPTEGSFVDLLFGKQISETVSLTSEETDKYELKQTQTDEGTSVTWNALAMTEEKDCYLATEHIKMLKGIFEKLDKDKKINMSNFTTAMKIFDKAKELNL